MSAFEGHMRVGRANTELLGAATNLLSSRFWDEAHPEDAHGADSIVLAEEQMALAARELVRAVELLPESDRPVGWNDGEGR